MYNSKSQYICRKHNTKKQLLSNEIIWENINLKLETHLSLPLKPRVLIDFNIKAKTNKAFFTLKTMLLYSLHVGVSECGRRACNVSCKKALTCGVASLTLLRPLSGFKFVLRLKFALSFETCLFK